MFLCVLVRCCVLLYVAAFCVLVCGCVVVFVVVTLCYVVC